MMSSSSSSPLLLNDSYILSHHYRTHKGHASLWIRTPVLMSQSLTLYLCATETPVLFASL